MGAIRKTDAQIHRDVLDELSWDRRVDEKEVGVQVAGGVVTLTGTVSSLGKRLAAQEAAHRVAGVLDVANDLVVKTPWAQSPSDTEIAQAIRHALEWDVFIPHERVTSTVTDGQVTLEGTLESWGQKIDIERIIGRLAGVRSVVNRIGVTPPNVTDDVKKAIDKALDRRAQRTARRIRVEVRDGLVTLTGTVQSREEHDSVLGTVRSTSGVCAVRDRLRMEAAHNPGHPTRAPEGRMASRTNTTVGRTPSRTGKEAAR